MERILVRQDTSADGAFERLISSPLVPWNVDEWVANGAVENDLAAVAAQVLHGDYTKLQIGGEFDVATLYNASVELASRHGIALYAADLDYTAADGLALRFVDRDVTPGEAYVYRVYLAGPLPEYLPLCDTGYAYVLVTPYSVPEPPVYVKTVSEEQAITVAWEDFDVAGYSGYHVYRSEDGGKTYSQVTEVPIVNGTPDTLASRQLTYRDSALINYKEYFYQIRGLTPFAELSQPATTSGSPRDLTPPETPIMNKTETPGGTIVELSWAIEDNAGDIDGFDIHRSVAVSGPFFKINTERLPSTARSYFVPDGNETEVYFKVVVYDTAGNFAHSHAVLGEIIDTKPPSVPDGLTGTIDTTGIVNLHWNLGPEPDIIGYHVLFANDSTHEFTYLTGRPWTDTAFIDTVEVTTLTKNVYYRVIAVDTRKHHSHMSEIFELRRPDVVPPESSVFHNLVATDSSVILFWHPSTSTDLSEQILLRRDPGATEPREIARFDGGVATYEDRDVVQKNLYEYLLVAEDETGLRSEPSPPVQGRPYDDGIRPGIADLRAEYDPDARTITLTWDYVPSSTEGKHWFVLYRGGLDEPIGQFTAVASDQRVYVDGDISGRPVYRYAVRVLSSTTESPLSDEVIVSLTR